LSDHNLRPPPLRSAQQKLDELKRSLSLEVIKTCTPAQIRAQSLANMFRWKSQGTWNSVYEEWTDICNRGHDGELLAVMLGQDDRSNRLRQSMPYVGLLTDAQVKTIYEDARA
jgi:hypothetical protein